MIRGKKERDVEGEKEMRVEGKEKNPYEGGKENHGEKDSSKFKYKSIDLTLQEGEAEKIHARVQSFNFLIFFQIVGS